MEQIQFAYVRPKETIAAIMMLYKNTKVKVRSPDGDSEYFDIAAGVLQGDTLSPYLFIICLEIELFWHWNCVPMLNWIVWNRTVFVCKTELFEIELFIFIKMDLALITYNGWCTIKPNKTKSTYLDFKIFRTNEICFFFFCFERLLI